MSRRRIPWYWLAGGVIVVATNNVIQFVSNIQTGDTFVYAMIAIMAFVTFRDISIGGAFK